MDPDICLQELRVAVDFYRQATDRQGRESEAERICELFTALDDWLCDGGFVPASWGSIRFTGEG